jgi:hypothetical protein
MPPSASSPDTTQATLVADRTVDLLTQDVGMIGITLSRVQKIAEQIRQDQR